MKYEILVYQVYFGKMPWIAGIADLFKILQKSAST